MEYNDLSEFEKLNQSPLAEVETEEITAQQINLFTEQFLSLIQKMILGKLDNHKIISGTVVEYDEGNCTAKVCSVSDSTIWTNVPNQSIYRKLTKGMFVKMFCQDGNPSNSWIFAVGKTNIMSQNMGQELTTLIRNNNLQHDRMSRQISILTQQVADLTTKIETLEKK